VFFSSTTTLFDDALKELRELVKITLKEQGFTGILNTTTSTFNKNDLRTLKVSFKPALKCDVLPCDAEEILDNQAKVFLTDLHEVIKNLSNDEGTEEAVTDTLITNLLVHVAGMHYHPLRV
ncbi:3395_t:CDS:2, partial [Scutellospora calospora]